MFDKAPQESRAAAGRTREAPLVYLALLGMVALIIFFVARADDPLYRLSLPEDGHVVAVSFRPDGEHLATGFRDGTIKLWDAADGTERATLTPPQVDDDTTIERMVFSLDGTRLAVINAVSPYASSDNRIHLWDIPDRTLLHILAHPTGRIGQVVVSPDGSRLAARAFDHTRSLSVIRVWDTTDGTLLDTFEGQPRTSNVIAFSPDGTRLVDLFALGTEYQSTQRSNLLMATIPSVICIGGVYLFKWGVVVAIMLYNVSLVGSLAIAMLPLLVHALKQHRHELHTMTGNLMQEPQKGTQAHEKPDLPAQ